MAYALLNYSIDFILIPCDGSVVTGVGDVGCQGHRNAIGHREIADFLLPKLIDITGWDI